MTHLALSTWRQERIRTVQKPLWPRGHLRIRQNCLERPGDPLQSVVNLQACFSLLGLENL